MFDDLIPSKPAARRSGPVDVGAIAAAEGASAPVQAIARSVYMQESSGGRNTKTSNAGAVGGMQITPATFARFARPGEDINDPEANARAAVRYLKHLETKAGSDPQLIAVGYYGGEGAIPKARAGIAVRDPRNPGAPDTLQYGREVADRAGLSGGQRQQPADLDFGDLVPQSRQSAGQPRQAGTGRGDGYRDPRMIGSATEREQVTAPAERRAYRQGRTEAGGVTRGLANVLQGPTFGFADEIGGGIGALIDVARRGGSLAEAYRTNRDYLRGASDQAAADNPLLSAVTQSMASAPTMVLGMGANLVRGAGTAANVGRAAITGATTGALTGAGRSEASSLGGVATDAAEGAATGAALGSAASGLGAAVGAVGRNVAARAGGQTTRDVAAEKLAEALLRDARGAAAKSGDAAAARTTARLRTLGPEATLADAGGANVRQLADTLATLPGATKDAADRLIRDRQAGRAARLIGSADAALGAGGQRLAPTLQALEQQRAADAVPLYNALRGSQLAPTDEMRSIIAAAEELGAGKLARTIATAERQAYTLGDDAAQAYRFADLDRLKRGLDTMISREVESGRTTATGAALTSLKNALVGEMDRATVDPATGKSLYAAARAAYAGPSALMGAAEAGRAAVSKGETGIRQAMAGLSESELQAFRVGAFDALRTKIGASDVGRGEILNLWKNPAARERLQALFGDERSFRRFAVDAARESRLKALESVGKGSQTAARQFGAGDLDMDALQAIGTAGRDIATGSPIGAAAALSTAWNRVAMPEAVRDEIGRMLLARGPDAAASLNALRGTANRVQSARAARAAALGGLSGRLGGASVADSFRE